MRPALLENRLQLLKQKREILPRRPERRREPQHTAVGLFAEHPTLLKRLRPRTGRFSQLDGPDEASATYGRDGRVPELRELRAEPLAGFCRAGYQVFVLQHGQRFQCHRTGQRIATKVLPCEPGSKSPSTSRRPTTADTG